MLKRLMLVVCWLPALVCAPAHAQLTDRFTLQPIIASVPTLLVPLDVNQRGEVVGVSQLGPFHWRAGAFSFLPLPAGFSQGKVCAINAHGVVVGYVESVINGQHVARAVRWENGVVGFLPIPTGSPWALALDINDVGTAIGYGAVGALEWPAANSFQLLPTLPGAQPWSPLVLRADGAIAGTFMPTPSTRGVCTLVNGQLQVVIPPVARTIAVNAFAANGAIYGHESISIANHDSHTEPVAYVGGQIVTLPSFDSANASGSVNDAHSSGWCVGTANGRAAVWSNGVVQDLATLVVNTHGLTLAQATAVSENSLICGTGWVGSTSTAFLLSPECGATSYCTAGTSSSGCTATLATTGVPSVAATSGFTVSAAGLDGQRACRFFYGVSGAQSAPWGGASSWSCVQPPFQRTTAFNSAGTFGACDGSFALDLSAYLASHANALGMPFYAGNSLWLQAWYRDPTSPQRGALSDALAIVFCH